jgi:hypothetical protein
MSDDIRSDRIYSGNVTFTGNLYPPAGAITSTSFTANANERLATSKQIHRLDMSYQQATGTDVVTATHYLRVCRGAGELLGVSVRPLTAPTGGDKAFTVDVQKASNASGSFSSLLNAVVTVNSSSVDQTEQVATLAATPTTADGDCLRLVVTASGSTGSQGQGVVVTLWYEENPS